MLPTDSDKVVRIDFFLHFQERLGEDSFVGVGGIMYPRIVNVAFKKEDFVGKKGSFFAQMKAISEVISSDIHEIIGC
jgi:hypothetical protein